MGLSSEEELAEGKEDHPDWRQLRDRYGADFYFTDGATTQYRIYRAGGHGDENNVLVGTYPDFDSFKSAIAALPRRSAYAYTSSDIAGVDLLTPAQFKEIKKTCKRTGKKFHCLAGG